MPNWIDANDPDPRIVMAGSGGDLELLPLAALQHSLHKYDCISDVNYNFPIPVWANTAYDGDGVLYTGVFCPARVSIGTNEPEYNFHVNGTAGVNDILVVGDYFDLDSKLQISTGGDEALTIITQTDMWSDVIDIVNEEDLSESIFKVTNTGNIVLHYFEGGNPFAIKIANTDEDMFRISPEGGIDMNYSGPTDGSLVLNIHSVADDDGIFALTSDGKVWCQGLEVIHTPFWGDFVFDDAYQLMPLKQVAKFIGEHKHLPDFPSAKEIETNGLDVYEMIRLLTIKVEELTLYTIELENK